MKKPRHPAEVLNASYWFWGCDGLDFLGFLQGTYDEAEAQRYEHGPFATFTQAKQDAYKWFGTYRRKAVEAREIIRKTRKG